jgi:hypothetical protein
MPMGEPIGIFWVAIYINELDQVRENSFQKFATSRKYDDRP